MSRNGMAGALPAGSREGYAKLAGVELLHELRDESDFEATGRQTTRDRIQRSAD